MAVSLGSVNTNSGIKQTPADATRVNNKVSIIKINNPTINIAKDKNNVVEPPKSDLSAKELIKLVDETCTTGCSADEQFEKTERGLVSLTSTVLSPVNAPIVAPVKAVLNTISTGNTAEDLVKSVNEGNYLDVTTNSVNSVKNSWSTAVSVSTALEVTAEAAAKYKLLSATKGVAIGTKLKDFKLVANKVALPFAVIGTAISGISAFKEGKKISDRKDLLTKLEHIDKKGGVAQKDIDSAKQKVKDDISKLKVNTSLKATSFTLSAISTTALIVAVRNPAKAKTAMTVSIAASLAGGIASAFSDAEYRKITSNFVSKKLHLSK